jgi:hypothetical protein
MSSPQAGGTPLVGFPQLLFQYIHNYTPYLEAVFPIRNLRTRHAAVTRAVINNSNILNNFLMIPRDKTPASPLLYGHALPC